MVASNPALTAPKPLLLPDVKTGASLGFIAGFVDAAGFMALSGLFTSHITGNFVLIGADLVTGSHGALAKLLALPAFALAVGGTRLLSLALERRGIAALPHALRLEALLLAGFMGLGLVLAPDASPDAPLAILVGMLGVAAMGMQSAAGRMSLAHLPASTVMTVNVTQIVIDMVDLIRHASPDTRRTAATRVRRTAPVALAFAVGALAGAFGVIAYSFWCLILPILLATALSLVEAEAAGPRTP